MGCGAVGVGVVCGELATPPPHLTALLTTPPGRKTTSRIWGQSHLGGRMSPEPRLPEDPQRPVRMYHLSMFGERACHDGRRCSTHGDVPFLRGSCANIGQRCAKAGARGIRKSGSPWPSAARRGVRSLLVHLLATERGRQEGRSQRRESSSRGLPAREPTWRTLSDSPRDDLRCGKKSRTPDSDLWGRTHEKGRVGMAPPGSLWAPPIWQQTASQNSDSQRHNPSLTPPRRMTRSANNGAKPGRLETSRLDSATVFGAMPSSVRPPSEGAPCWAPSDLVPLLPAPQGPMLKRIIFSIQAGTAGALASLYTHLR